MTKALVLSLLYLAPALFAFCALRSLYRQGAFDVLREWWCRTSRLSRAVAVVLVSGLDVYGSDEVGGSAIGRQMKSALGRVVSAVTNAFRRVWIATGYAVASTVTNEVHDFTMPNSAAVASDIAATGANRDGLWHFHAYTNAQCGCMPTRLIQVAMHFSLALLPEV